MDIPMTIVGNLVSDPELRYTQSGTAALSFRVAVNRRQYDKNTGQWVDGEATFVACQAWKSLAENIAESASKGDSIICTGVLRGRSYETKTGERRSINELNVQAAGLNLQWAGVEKRAGVPRDDAADGASAFGGDYAPPF